MPPLFYQNKAVAVVGASRGIGLEWARQLAARGCAVSAGARTVTPELEALAARSGGKVVVSKIDTTSESSIAAWADGVAASTDRLALIVNNAGVAEWAGLEAVTADSLVNLFKVNTVGPILVVQALLKRNLLGKGSTIANITSKMGSVSDSSGGTYAYRCSKAALNMATIQMDHDLKGKGITAAVLHPGWVATRMTSNNGLIDAATSVSGMLDVLEAGASGELDLHGHWFDYKRDEIMW